MSQDINDMMVFLAVVESGSFTVAAERLGIPKANVSRKVSRLEEFLGVTLLGRSTRSQHLTDVGKRYLMHCKRIHEEVDLAEAAVFETLHTYKGTIKIGASVTIGQQILKPSLAPFLHQYPDITLQLSLVNQRVDLIEEGFDMLIRVGMLDDSRLIAKRLGNAKRKLYASPSYFKGRTLPQQVDEISEYDILLMSALNREHKIELVSGRKQKALRINPRLVVDDLSLLKQSIVDGLGVGVLPEYMCDKEIDQGGLINILPDWGMSDIDIYALYPRHRVNIPKIKSFLDFIAELFSRRL